jgi:hypothetical protein
VKHIFIPVLLLLSLTVAAQPQKKAAAAPQSKPFVLGKTVTLASAVMGEKRIINLYLPDGFHKDWAYPVIYLLDGSANEDFVHVAGLLQFGNMMQFFPQSILVGIANVDRKRDFTFPTNVAEDKKAYPTTGGSARFISFIGKELQPYIGSQYKTTGHTTFIGQSLGGLLATEILLKQPELFSDYIIVSPSLWWDDESLLKSAPALMRGRVYDGKRVCVSVGNEHPQMVAEANNLAGLLKAAPVKGLTVHHIPMPEEDHATILHRALYKALEALYPKAAIPQ